MKSALVLPSIHASHNLNLVQAAKVYLRVVGRGNPVEVARDLGPQVRDHDKLLEDILGEYVGVARLLDVVAADIDVVGAEVEVGGADGAHPPLGLAGKGIPLVVARRARDDLVAVLVHRSGGRGRQLLSEGEKIMLINFF